jgi:tRNA pseudouridine55 synthase
VEELAGRNELEQSLPHPRRLLPGFPAVSADEHTAGRLRNGAQVNLPEFSGAPLVKVFSSQRRLLAIARRVAGTLFQPLVVFPG